MPGTFAAGAERAGRLRGMARRSSVLLVLRQG